MPAPGSTANAETYFGFAWRGGDGRDAALVRTVAAHNGRAAINHRQPSKADRYFSSPHSERIRATRPQFLAKSPGAPAIHYVLSAHILPHIFDNPWILHRRLSMAVPTLSTPTSPQWSKFHPLLRRTASGTEVSFRALPLSA